MQRNSLIHKIKRNGSPNSQRCATGVCGGWKMMRGVTKGRGGEREKAPPLAKWSDITKEKDPVPPDLFIICHIPFKSSMHAELHFPVVIQGFDLSLNESYMTLCQMSWYVTQNLLINAHFIILWPPGCSSLGGFDPFLRLKKIKSASHLNISVQNLSWTFFFFFFTLERFCSCRGYSESQGCQMRSDLAEQS